MPVTGTCTPRCSSTPGTRRRRRPRRRCSRRACASASNSAARSPASTVSATSSALGCRSNATKGPVGSRWRCRTLSTRSGSSPPARCSRWSEDSAPEDSALENSALGLALPPVAHERDLLAVDPDFLDQVAAQALDRSCFAGDPGIERTGVLLRGSRTALGGLGQRGRYVPEDLLVD